MYFLRKLQQLRPTPLIMYFALLLIPPQACSAQGEEYSCELEYEEKCITKVKWNIPEKYAKDGKHFTVSYVTIDGKTEMAVALHNVGHYMCEGVRDHTCEQNSPSTSATIHSVTVTSCVTGRMYILAADGEKGFPCTPTQNGKKPSVEIEDSIEDSDSPCSTVSDEDNGRDGRKTAGRKCTQKLSEQEETFQSGEADKVAIGISCGVVILFILLAAGVTSYLIKNRRKEKGCMCGYDAVATAV